MTKLCIFLVSWFQFPVHIKLKVSQIFWPSVIVDVSFQASKAHLEKHYADLSSKGFFAGLVTYMASGPVVAMVSVISFILKFQNKFKF